GYVDDPREETARREVPGDLPGAVATGRVADPPARDEREPGRIGLPRRLGEAGALPRARRVAAAVASRRRLRRGRRALRKGLPATHAACADAARAAVHAGRVPGGAHDPSRR